MINIAVPGSGLIESRDYLIETVQAISAVVELNTVIIDADLQKLADSDNVDASINQVSEWTLAGQALRSNTNLFVTDAVQNPLCSRCLTRSSCRDKAQIVIPIRIDNAAAGVIVLNAKTDTQRERLLGNKDNYIRFLSRMANLISMKIVADQRLRRIEVLEKQLMKVVNEVEHGIIHVDKQRIVVFFNDVANRYLNRVLYNGISIDEAIPEAKGMCISSHPFVFTRSGVTYSAKTKRMDSSGALLDLQRTEDIQTREKEVRQQLHGNRFRAKSTFTDIIGNAPSIVEAIRAAEKFSNSDGTVLILAATGTGKELFAQSIHNMSHRRGGPFVAVNCSAISRDLLESELFGYAHGAFTGASKEGKAGLFEQAHGGTIFLDEIGDMPMPLQTSVLRVLQEKEVRRVGDDKIIPIDVRVIAATNCDLQALVQDDLFRMDLYYRLNVLVLRLPMLASRKADIPLLADHFIKVISEEHSLNQINLTPECYSLLQDYSWPGNVRELENVMQRIMLLSEGVDDFRDLVASVMNELRTDRQVNGIDSVDLKLNGNFKDLQRQLIERVLESADSREEAARMLGISSRTLYRRLKEFARPGN